MPITGLSAHANLVLAGDYLQTGPPNLIIDPAVWNVALYTIMPDVYGIGGAEPSPAANYERQATIGSYFAGALSAWTAPILLPPYPLPGRVVILNAHPIQWREATADWGLIVGWGIYTATPQFLWVGGVFTIPRFVFVGQYAYIKLWGITITTFNSIL